MDQTPCPYCKIPISKDASKCGHCQEWLPLGRFSIRNPLFYTPLLILVIALFVYFALGLMNQQPSTSKFVKGTTKIDVLSDEILRNGKRLFILGKVKNNDMVNWDNVYVSANYFDKQGRLIDSSTDLVHLKTGETQPYQIEFHNYDKSDPDLYVDYKVEITAASNYGR